MQCWHCFHEKINDGPCPLCGYDPRDAEEKYPLALSPGTILNGRYIIGRVLGQGGFGITYIAQDYQTKERVAVKEYLPVEFAGRSEDRLSVKVYSADRRENFDYGREQFLEEAKTLAAFLGNAHIVRIYSYFEENGTAYFSMEYADGLPLDRYLASTGRPLRAEEANSLFLPVMEALEDIHRKGIVHRDISPDNIIVTPDGSAKLIDFGAARYSTGEKSRSLDVILKHGFAPREQYTRRGRQGPWTDVYAVAATYYYAVTGKVPPDAIDRMEEDLLIPPGALGSGIDPETEAALMKGLRVNAADRWQHMADFAAALAAPSRRAAEKAEAERLRAEQQEQARQAREQARHEREAARAEKKAERHAAGKRKKKLLPLLLMLVLLLLLAYGVSYGLSVYYAMQGNGSAARKALLLPQLTALHDPALSPMIDACEQLETGDYEASEAAFRALVPYLNSGDLTNESMYRHALALLEQGDADGALTYLRGLWEMQYRDSDRFLREAAMQVISESAEKENYYKAITLFNEMDALGLFTDERFKAETLRETYDAAVAQYRSGGSSILFNYLGDYERTEDYLTLINSQDPEELLPLIGFEDAGARIFSSSGTAVRFLGEDTWRGRPGTISASWREDRSSWSIYWNLDGISGSWVLRNSILSAGNTPRYLMEALGPDEIQLTRLELDRSTNTYTPGDRTYVLTRG